MELHIADLENIVVIVAIVYVLQEEVVAQEHNVDQVIVPMENTAVIQQ